MRFLRPSVTSTYRSRGNESTATWLVVGSTRHTMIVSLRSPSSCGPRSHRRRENRIDAGVVVGTRDEEVLGLGIGRRERRVGRGRPGRRVRRPSAARRRPGG